MYPVISVGGVFEIPLYGVMFLIGAALAVQLGRRMGAEVAVPGEDVLYGAVYALIGILVGAKAVYFITKVPPLLSVLPAVKAGLAKDPGAALIYLINFLFGGYVYYGGLIGAVAGVYCYCRQYKVRFLSFMDLFAPLIPLVHGMGRIGCFLAGCCYGIEYHGFGSVQFPPNKLIPALDDVPRIPVQLIEAGFNFIFFAIMLYLFHVRKLRGGRLLGIYLLYYSVARFCLELLRGDKIRGRVGYFSTSQLISMVLIPVGIYLVMGKLEERKR